MKKARKITIITLILLSIAMLGTGVGLYRRVTAGAELRKELLPSDENRTILYDGSGAELESGHYAKLEEISPYIPKAFIAMEDKRFYRHNGVDFLRLGGAAIANVKSGKIKEGGSTITCQLVKNTHLNGEKTLKRKLQEHKIAFSLEKEYSKDEIMEMYLNVIYFGNGIYGVKDACRRFFGKDPKSVTLSEAASLAATVANPLAFSPLQNPSNNQSRKGVVLQEMRDSEMISDDECENAKNDKIIINYTKSYNNYADKYTKLTYFEAATLLSLSEQEIKTRGYRIYTYFDKDLQSKATGALLSDETSAEKELLLADNRRHGIVAYACTEKSFSERRQPGSLLKPFLYASAIDEGRLLPDSPVEDAPVSVTGYAPSNYKGIYYGWITAREALSKSSNAVAVNLLQEIGIEKGFQTIKKCGIPLVDSDKNLSLALGGTTKGSTLPEIATGYATLACGGSHHDLSTIRKITDKNGRILYENTGSKRVLSEESTFLTVEMMKTCARTGTAKQLSYLDLPIAAKTGTVAKGAGNSDAWCAGFTTEHTFVCRYASKGEPLPASVTGGNQPTKALRALLRELYKDAKPQDFAPPSGLRKATISTHVRDKHHKLALAEAWDTEDRAIIYATTKFSFEKIDPTLLFLENLEVIKKDNTIKISFSPAKKITYRVKMNGKSGFLYEGEYLFPRPTFPLAKLEIECFSDGKRIYRKSEILRL